MPWSRYRPGVDSDGWDDLLTALAGWAADERAASAARSRTRRRWLSRQATETATLAGVLLDLSERRADVTIDTVGSRHRGRLVAVATELCVLRTADGGAALVALPAVTHLTTGSTGSNGSITSITSITPIGDRTPPLELDLAYALTALAADRPAVCLELLGGNRVAGTLHSVGTDLVSVQVDGPPPETALIALDAVVACLL
jgi:hypothetical protein